MSANDPAIYATRHTCGRIVAAAVADKDAAQDVARWAKEGRAIETISLEPDPAEELDA